MKVPFRDSPLLGVFWVSVIVALAGGSWLTSNVDLLPCWLKPFVEGFGGNLAAGVVGSFLFLILTTHLDRRTNAQISRIHEAAKKSEELLSKRERILHNQELMAQFDDFLRRHSYYDVRFPNLKSAAEPLGLQYTIEPVRDPKTSQSLKRETEMEVQHVIRVQGPAYWQFMKEEEQKAYEGSPIREGEYYFCRFFDGSWHMATDSVMDQAHRFYLSGKVGPSEWGMSANAFVATKIESPFKNMTKVGHLLLGTEDGTLLNCERGCNQYDLYKDESGDPHLSINDSPPKKIYFTTPPDTYEDANWFLVISAIGGRATGQKLENIKNAIRDELTRLDVKIPQVSWYVLNNPANERP